MSTRSRDPSELIGRSVYGSDGEKLGRIEDVLTDEDGTVRYVEVKTGLLGAKHHAVPAEGLDQVEQDLMLPYTRQQLEEAPAHDVGEAIDPARRRELAAHYGSSAAPGAPLRRSGEQRSR